MGVQTSLSAVGLTYRYQNGAAYSHAWPGNDQQGRGQQSLSAGARCIGQRVNAGFFIDKNVRPCVPISSSTRQLPCIGELRRRRGSLRRLQLGRRGTRKGYVAIPLSDEDSDCDDPQLQHAPDSAMAAAMRRRTAPCLRGLCSSRFAADAPFGGARELLPQVLCA